MMRRRNAWAVSGVVIAGVAVWLVHGPAAQEPADDAFTGHWRLVSFENFAADGTATSREMSGRIMYDGRGNMSAQLMPTGDTVTAAENRRTEGYVAYFGGYTIDESAGIVTHSVEGSNIFPWVGTDLVRHFDFSDGKLLLSLKSDDRVTGTLTWERIE